MRRRSRPVARVLEQPAWPVAYLPAAPPSARPVTVRPSAPSGVHRPPRLQLASGMSKAEASAIVRRSTLLLDIDESGSMLADERCVRCAAAVGMVRLMRQLGGGRAGVLRWSHRVESELAPIDVRRGVRRIEQALAPARPYGGNDVVAALRRSATLLPSAGPGEHQAVAVITDGQEFSFRPDADDHLRAADAAMTDLAPAQVHVVLVDHQGHCSPAEEALWRSLPVASFTRLSLGDPDQFCREVAGVVFGGLGIPLAPAPTPRRFAW